jgi:ABC-type glutathione transport system ATPase component
LTEAPLLQVKDLVHEFRTDLGTVHAVSGVSFDVRAGETLGIVGETGSGKSTLARSILQASRPTSGEVILRGEDLAGLRGARLLQARRHLQMVFQDPFGSLDPKWRVRDLVEEPLIAYKTGDRNARRRRVDEVLELVGLAQYGGRRPRELSGGQAQRVAIARAVALSPALIICDEAVSSLDVLIQAQVLNLFERLRAELGLSYLFIAHDLALVKQVSDRLPVCCGPTRGEAARRAVTLGEVGARMLTMGVTGTPGDIIGRLAELHAAGADTVYFHLYDVTDLDHVRLLGAEVLPQLT